MGISYDEFKDAIQDGARRRSLLNRDGRPFFILLSQQFSRDELEQLCDTATAIRRLDRHRDGREFLLGILRGHRVMNLFAQPSHIDLPVLKRRRDRDRQTGESGTFACHVRILKKSL